MSARSNVPRMLGQLYVSLFELTAEGRLSGMIASSAGWVSAAALLVAVRVDVDHRERIGRRRA